jgi:hypothetical protein
MSAFVRPGRVKLQGGSEWLHASTNASGGQSRNSTRPPSPSNGYIGRSGYSPPTSPVDEDSRPSTPVKRYLEEEGSDDGNNSD